MCLLTEQEREMKKLLGLSLLTLLSVASAADFKMSSRSYEENTKGEIIQVDGKTLNSKGESVMTSQIMRSRIKQDGETYTNTQHILVPATAEVRNSLLQASGEIVVEGSILDTKKDQSGIATFLQVKLLVREVK